MTHAVITIEINSDKRVDLALPINVPSRVLANSIAQALKLATGGDVTYTLAVRTEKGMIRALSTATLSDMGVLDGFVLVLQEGKRPPSYQESIPYASLRSETDEIFLLDSHTILIGRKDIKHGIMVDIDLTPFDNETFISRRHAKIEKEDEQYYLSDLASVNGTRLNGKRLALKDRILLQDGDTIQFGRGNIVFTFVAKK